MNFEQFLRGRDISEETIRYFRDEKIDCSTFAIIPEEQVKKLIPKLGDRVAIKSFCSKKQSSATKQSLLERLRSKMASKKTENSSKEAKPHYKKKTRIIEIGWLNMDKEKNTYRQVRAKYGGGTRRITRDKTSTCSNILDSAKDIFFPGGVSLKGPASNFSFELLDYKHHKFDSNLTIQDMYENTGLTTLRFYLATVCKENNNETQDEYIPCTATTANLETADHETSTQSCSFSKSSTATRYNISDEDDENFSSVVSNKNTSHSLSGTLPNYEDIATSTLTDFFSSFNESDETSFFHTPTRSVTPSAFIDENQTLLTFHRGKVFEELIEALERHMTIISFENIKIEMVLPNGHLENAEDMGGVLRDALSEFWQSFYEKCTVGTVMKIPYLRHDFGENKWTIIGKVMKMGYENQKYFPIQIASSFIESCLSSQVHPNEDKLVKEFYKYISESDYELINKASENIEEVDNDDLLDVFATYDTKIIPNKDNIKRLVLEIAHKELIQKPSFVAKCFSLNLKGVLSPNDLCKIYSDLDPTPKNIIAKICLPPSYETNPNFIKITGFLKKFIKESDLKTRSAFLRFCTGSDLVLRTINVSFINSVGFGRTPIAHTCSGQLDLPSTYDNFVDFRGEFSNILNSNYWVMDIL